MKEEGLEDYEKYWNGTPYRVLRYLCVGLVDSLGADPTTSSR